MNLYSSPPQQVPADFLETMSASTTVDGMTLSAEFSGIDNRFRDKLTRVWDADRPMLVVCMLNPSTADHRRDDPTVLALIHFAKLWGYGGLWVVNLYSLRTSSPTEMMRADDRIGPENAKAINAALDYARSNSSHVLAAWGNHGNFEGRAEWFCSVAAKIYHVDLLCLGTTSGWHPKHPMARGKHRIPRDQQPIVWREGD